MSRLRDLREQRNLKQADVAKALHISRQSYNFYENQQRDPKPEMLIRLADFFDVSIDYLLGRTNLPNSYNSPQINDTAKDAKDRLHNKISSADPETAAELEQYLNYLESKKNQQSKTADDRKK